MRDNQLAQWLIQGVSVLAFILLVQFAAGFLPQQGIPGAVRKAVTFGKG